MVDLLFLTRFTTKIGHKCRPISSLAKVYLQTVEPQTMANPRTKATYTYIVQTCDQPKGKGAPQYEDSVF